MSHTHPVSQAALLRWMQMLLACDRILLQSQDPMTMYQAVCRCMVEHSDIDLACIGTMDQNDTAVWPQAHYGRGQDDLAFVKTLAKPDPQYQDAIQQAVAHSTPVWNDHTATDLSAARSAPSDATHWRSWGVLPLAVHDRVMGVLMLRSLLPGLFDAQAQSLLQQLGTNLNQALVHQTQEQARREVEFVLAESESRYSSIFANHCMPMLLIDPDTAMVVDANIRAVNFYGYDQPTLLKLKVSDINILPPDVIRAEMQAAAKSGKNHFDFRHRLANGDIRDVEVFSSPISYGGQTYLLSTIHDITQRKREQERAEKMQWLVQRFIDEIPGTVFLKDSQLRLLMVNRYLCEQLGQPREAVLGKTARELFPKPFADIITDTDFQMLTDGGQRTFEEHYQDRHFETHMFVIEDNQGERLLGGLSLDATDRYEASEFTTVLLQINELGGILPERDFLTRGLEMAEKLTHSEIAFLHFVNEDQQTLELVTWSTGALRGCSAAFDAHYPVEQAGIWADCVRQRKPVMFNDYAHYAAKRGLPEGHAPLIRLISVPVIEGDCVKMILGVGNKPADYTDHDVDALSLIGNDLWRITRRARAETALKTQLQEVTALNTRLADAQSQLVQSEKMASVGQLAAGVAHEINNPVGFVKSNLGTLAQYVQDMLVIYKQYKALAQSGQAPTATDLKSIKAAEARADIDFLLEDLPHLITESQEGVERVSHIVLDLKNFSRSGDTQWAWADLMAGLESTLNVVWNQIKYKAELVRDLTPLPQVYCVASQINQVLMNILVNASQSIQEHGRITLRSGVQGEQVWIEVQDTGCGIDPEHLGKIFEPFFTTKPSGQGTGLGLSISADIVRRHQGHIDVDSTPGKGTRFRIWLPVFPAAQQEQAEQANAAA